MKLKLKLKAALGLKAKPGPAIGAALTACQAAALLGCSLCGLGSSGLRDPLADLPEKIPADPLTDSRRFSQGSSRRF